MFVFKLFSDFHTIFIALKHEIVVLKSETKWEIDFVSDFDAQMA